MVFPQITHSMSVIHNITHKMITNQFMSIDFYSKSEYYCFSGSLS